MSNKEIDYAATDWQGVWWALKYWFRGQDPFWTDYLLAPHWKRLERFLRRAWCQRYGCIPYSSLSWKYTIPPYCYRCGGTNLI